ncbi:hypothetical protein LEN_4782 [Lysobacter enzymogenes]|uniref:Uncharacterized protein n=1 Tax=Lysobacter enzymogenes TaxID=69 RepID=A0AAU9B1N9_LYSEN|nr:hypothetical protein LEN_4782 [Lysobacter enzymogenes]
MVHTLVPPGIKRRERDTKRCGAQARADAPRERRTGVASAAPETVEVAHGEARPCAGDLGKCHRGKP